MKELTDWLPLAYDVLAALLLLYYIYGASHKGFAATMINLVGYAAAFAAAWPLARIAAGGIFDALLRENLLARVTQMMAEHPESMDLMDSAARFLEALPSYAANVVLFRGMDAGELADLLGAVSGDGARMVVDELLAPLLTGVLSTILFVVIFSLLLILVRRITRAFYVANRIPVIGPLNSILGGLAGLVMGAVGLYVLFLILELTAALTGGSLTFLNRDILQQSFFYRLLGRFDPIGLLGTITS